MKPFQFSIATALFVLLPLVSQAGPNVSGGVPETQYQHDRSAISTILENQEMNDLLSNKGGIKGIAPVQAEEDVFEVTTESCSVKVRFERPCTFEPGGLPQCEYKSELISDTCK